MKVCTLGLGYIGLPTSLMLAKHNVEVVGVDVKPEIIELLNAGKATIEEHGLQEILNEVIENNKFHASLSPENADVFIITVPTPNNNDIEKSCDLSYVLSAVESVLPFVNKGNVIIIESTIAPRSMDDIIKPLVEKSGLIVGKDVFLAHCPERVLPGQIFYELINNNRIIGGVTPECTESASSVYRIFVKGEIIKTNAKTAEMSKLIENTYRDVNIAFANELAKVCNELEINTLEVIEMANKHPRVNIHTPGPGVGGHCLAVDPYFISAKAPKTANLIKYSRHINSSMPTYVVENVNKIMQQSKGKIITIFGLTYKGNVNDIRESPAMEILEILISEGKYEVRTFDPHISNDFLIEDMEESIKDSDLILILVDHNEFKELDWSKFNSMATKQIFDTRNIVKNPPSKFKYINFGNLYKSVKKEAVTI
jgi:UDP-N-acetyl-D-mannosaminuronic acid dehydrogenase